jgi:hypothetical protein
MRRVRPAAFALAAWWLAAAAAPADPAPRVNPTRDVDITYKVPVPSNANTAILQRLRYSAALREQRVDLPTSGNWMVLNYATHRMAMVRDESREIVDLPAPEATTQPNAGGVFVRVGTATVANLACTEWRTHDTNGQETIACYTDDGVLLRARGPRGTMMEAITVWYATQGPEVFALPAGYSHDKGPG